MFHSVPIAFTYNYYRYALGYTDTALFKYVCVFVNPLYPWQGLIWLTRLASSTHWTCEAEQAT